LCPMEENSYMHINVLCVLLMHVLLGRRGKIGAVGTS
jgi:hypothetical protein